MKKRTNISKTFVIFLITAIFFWLLIKLSKNYTTTQKFSVVYINLPQDKLLQKDPVKEITINISGTGFKLLSAKITNEEIQLNANSLEKEEGSEYSLVLNDQLIDIQNQLPKGIKIETFISNNISLQLGVLASKKVPVIKNITVQYKVGFDLVNKIIMKPDSLVITGPKEVINAISRIETEKVELTTVSDNIAKEIKLKLPKKELNIRTSITSVFITGKVEKYTEGSFEIPFVVTNLPLDMKINTFPKSIKVIFKIPLKDFHKIEQNSFTVECDYNESKKNNLSYLIPKIINKPILIKSVKIAPSKIDFLIQK